MNKLLHGDCIELMKDIEDKSIDMILCDLPYGTTKNKWDCINTNRNFIGIEKDDHYFEVAKNRINNE